MEIPVIDFGMLETEKSSETMALLHQACQKWGFFMIENHGVEKELMEKLKLLTKMHYEENMKDSFFNSETAKSLETMDTSARKIGRAPSLFLIAPILTSTTLPPSHKTSGTLS
ncbi:UNVERIFIED_CONTAM: 1-aminocyclopropane-1-carboxylate oxidase 1 [Sesamum radiatum]|uniref:1-aminocyclopropane-1-carboxylate oxidase 1 n=1 Tax=Sesamum radiatum TaxID=300843 RepID=A0AAW2KNJ9_SESRA